MSILQASHLTKRFGELTAVDDISFELKEGEILGLLGPNGAGKTTTMQMLLAVLTPSSGEIFYFNKDLLKHREEILEKINFSSTYTNLPWQLTVKENLSYTSYLYNINNRKKRISKLIEIFNLQPLLNQNMNELSSGQMTRVNLAKAFINFPKILLLDEPTASLDPDIAEYIRRLLLNERKNFNVSILWTSHNMSEVEEVCDRVIFINHGKIIANDTPFNLVKTIKICHLELLINQKMQNVIDYCRKENIPHKHTGRIITCDIKDQNIPIFLKDMNTMNIEYNEISIEKPSLEDYFLLAIKK